MLDLFFKKIASTNTVVFRRMLVWVIKMLHYRWIDVSEGNDINKSNKSKECMICHYWYFKDIGYKFEPYVCNKCHDISMMVYDLNYFMIWNIKSVNYRCVLWNMTKNNAMKRLHNSKLGDKGTLWIYIFVQ